MVKFIPVIIPSNQSFLERWHAWVNYRVSTRFKRNKTRVPDIAQDVRIRLLAKDFIGRWFFRHLSDELLDIAQASKVLGLDGKALSFISSIPVANGLKRNDEKALWRVSDILNYAQFDHLRYFYSIQKHTLDTSKVLHLLGYGPEQFNSLASLYRQGRLLPSEFTEHACSGDRKTCSDCIRGRASLNRKGLSLTHNWESPEARTNVLRLRWNDGQLDPFLRNWKNKNRIVCTPEYVMRPEGDKGIDAGLLKYADIIIQNTVANIFKKMGRNEDVEEGINSIGCSPMLASDDLVAWETGDDDSTSRRVHKDSQAVHHFETIEIQHDAGTILDLANLTQVECDILKSIEIMEMTARQYAQHNKMKVSTVKDLHTSALEKLKYVIDFNFV